MLLTHSRCGDLMEQFLLALCGIPASGKTTLARAIQKKFGKGVVIVSTDRWRDAEYYAEFTPEKEQVVRERALQETRELISRGLSVIHDDTNYYQSMRHDLYEIAKDRECIFAVIHVNTSLKTALQWNREREMQIPEEVIERINHRLDIPGKKYLWDRAIMTINPWVMPLDSVVNDLAERLRAMHPLERARDSGEQGEDMNALLDVITRQVVKKFLQEMPEYRHDPEVSRLRRKVLREAIREGFSPYETEHVLRVRLGIHSARVS